MGERLVTVEGSIDDLGPVGGGFGLGGAGRGARFGRRGGGMNDGFMMIMLAMRVFEALKVRCWRGA